MLMCMRFRLTANARLCLGEKTIFPPQLRVPPRSAYSTSSVPFRFPLYLMFAIRFNVPTESTLAQPPLLSFQYILCNIASATKLCFAIEPRRSPESPNAPIGNSPRTHSVCACPKPTHARTKKYAPLPV